MAGDLKYEILNQLGEISEPTRAGRRKEFNRISWNGNAPKYDIRDWNADHSKAGKGVTLTEQELRRLKVLIDEEIALLDEDE